LGQVLNIAIAVAIGVVILRVGLWGIRMLAAPQASGPDPDEIVEMYQEYRCSVCGMRLTVTHAQDHEAVAPRHCREEMEPSD